VDSTTARAHQHAAGARRDGAAQREPPGGVDDEPPDHALGRSRGGFSTKLRLACEQGRKPLVMRLTAGQCGDRPQFIAVLDELRVPRVGADRPRSRPDRVLADKAYTSAANRAYLRRRGIRATIPIKTDQAASRRRKGSEGGPSAGLRRDLLQAAPRRRVRHQPAQTQPGRASRYEKLAVRYLATIRIAAINEWLPRHL
jgi:Transposase DDE domain